MSEHANKLRVVNVAGINYLGILNGRTLTGIHCSTANENGFRQYFKARATGKLVTLEIGEGKDLVTQQLDDNQKIVFTMVESQWAAAAANAKGWLVSKVFEEMFSAGK